MNSETTSDGCRSLRYYKLEQTEIEFRRLFNPIRSVIESKVWFVRNQPWMGLPENLWQPFEDSVICGNELEEGWVWRGSSLWEFASYFSEEYMDFWGLMDEVTPSIGAELYAGLSRDLSTDEIFESRRDLRIVYDDDAHWMFASDDERLVERLRSYLSLELKIESTQVEWGQS